MRRSRSAAVVLLALALAPAACRRYPVTAPPDAQPPDVAPIQNAPVLRPMPTPPGRQSEVPGPPAVSP